MPPVGTEGNRWLIYALGGGLGHLTRAIALARVATAGRRSCRILTNSPFAASVPYRHELGEQGSVVRIAPSLGRDEVAAMVRATLEPCDFDVLIVDTFPRGLGGELAPLLDRLPCPKVLVHRDLNPAYVAWADLSVVAARFDLIILPGEDAPLGSLPHAVRTAPWLLRDHAELLDRAESRRRLGLSCEERPLVVVVGSGRTEEIEAAGRLADRLADHRAGEAMVRLAAVSSGDGPLGPRAIRVWPLLEVMAGIDVLVGSGGYNTVHEARATATPLVALARARRYDRQAHRLSPAELAHDDAEVVDRVAERLDQTLPGCRVIPSYDNGVHAAVRLIDGVTARGR